jgi:ubiquinone/menaquinone biosynthesis C-methylase UbiE
MSSHKEPEIPKGQNDEEDQIRAKYARRKSRDTRYSWFSPGHLFMIQDRERHFLKLLKREGADTLEDRSILEVGCGQGYWLRDFVKWGAQPQNLTGVELLPDRLTEARRLCPEKVNILNASASRLPFKDACFDLVLQATVFTSIQDGELKRQVAAEMMRVVRPQGLILWYDFRFDNPRNPDVTAVRKREIIELFTGCRVDLTPITLAPPLMRPLARWSWLAPYLLGKMPWLCSHYMGVIRKI